jgi:hypothetical protein
MPECPLFPHWRECELCFCWIQHSALFAFFRLPCSIGEGYGSILSMPQQSLHVDIPGKRWWNLRSEPDFFSRSLLYRCSCASQICFRSSSLKLQDGSTIQAESRWTLTKLRDRDRCNVLSQQRRITVSWSSGICSTRLERQWLKNDRLIVGGLLL